MHSLGIIGYGKFGSLIAELAGRFAPHVTVRIHSSRRKPDGKIFFSLEETTRCDAVVLAVPIAALEEVLKRIVPLTDTHTVIVDVATVKMHPVRLLRRLARTRRFLATHPMWGPESYAKKGNDVSGFRIVISEHTLSRIEHRRLVSFLRSLGFNIVSMSAREHDKHLAETLFLTHYIGQIVSDAKFDRTVIDTVSFGFLMDAVKSVRHDAALFRDVFRFNPYCSSVLKRFERSTKRIHRMLR